MLVHISTPKSFRNRKGKKKSHAAHISDNDDGDRYKTVILGPSKPYDIDKVYKDGAGIPHNETHTINSTNLMITQIYGDK